MAPVYASKCNLHPCESALCTGGGPGMRRRWALLALRPSALARLHSSASQCSSPPLLPPDAYRPCPTTSTSNSCGGHRSPRPPAPTSPVPLPLPTVPGLPAGTRSLRMLRSTSSSSSMRRAPSVSCSLSSVSSACSAIATATPARTVRHKGRVGGNFSRCTMKPGVRGCRRNTNFGRV